MSSISSVSGVYSNYYLNTPALSEQQVVQKLQHKDPISATWLQEFRAFLRMQGAAVLTRLYASCFDRTFTPNKYPLLSFAVTYHHTEVVREILNFAKTQGLLTQMLVKPECFCAGQTTFFNPLMDASTPEIINLLLDVAASENVDLHTPDKDGCYPLAQACLIGDAIAVETILSHPTSQSRLVELTQAFSTYPPDKKVTAFQAAHLWNNANVVKMLLDVAGDIVDFFSEIIDGSCHLSMCIQEQRVDIVRIMLMHPTTKDKLHHVLSSTNNPKKYTPFFLACNIGNADMVNVLLDAAAEVDFDVHQLVKFKYPLHRAIALNHLEVVRAILTHPTSQYRVEELLLQQNFRAGVTALHYAFKKNHDDIVKLLLDVAAKAQVDIHVPCDRGYDPLYYGVLFGAVAALRVFLNHPSLTESISEMLRTPNVWKKNYTLLHEACALQNLEVVKLLLDAGAPHDVFDEHNNFPHALAGNDREISALFFYHLTGGRGNTDKVFDGLVVKLSHYRSQLKARNFEIEWGDLQSCLNECLKANFACEDLPYMPVVPVKLIKVPFTKLLYQDLILPSLQQKITQLDNSLQSSTSSVSGYELGQIRRFLEFLFLKIYVNMPREKRMVMTLMEQMDKIKEVRQLKVSREKVQNTQELSSFQEQYDNADVFVLLARWNLGIQFTLDCDSDSQPNTSSYDSSIDFTPFDSFKLYLGIDDEKKFYEYRLFEGRDLRAIGADMDIDFFMDQWEGCGNNQAFVDHFIMVMEEKQKLWKDILDDGAMLCRLDWREQLHQPEMLKELAEVYKENSQRLLVQFFNEMKKGHECLLQKIKGQEQSLSAFKAESGVSVEKLFELLVPHREKRSEPTPSLMVATITPKRLRKD